MAVGSDSVLPGSNPTEANNLVRGFRFGRMDFEIDSVLTFNFTGSLSTGKSLIEAHQSLDPGFPLFT